MNETQPDYAGLAIFAAVVEEASFSKAAQKLGIGKGTVSRAIARLERLLGAELVHRTTHSVALSTAGTALYERTAPHLSALDRAVLDLPERAREPSGVLRLTAPHDFGVVILPELLAQFARRYPDVRVDVRVTNVQLNLVAEGIDLAIRASANARKDSSLTSRRLGSTAGGFYAAPSYVARRGKPKRLGEPKHDWILIPRLTAPWKLPERASLRFACDDFLLARDLVREGAGIGYLPGFLAAPYVSDGLVESVPLVDAPRETGSFFLVYPSSGQVPRKVTAFRDFLLERLKKTPLA
jgi:DNA-binding transcriptional LysR family regulator